MITSINEWKIINEIGEANVEPYNYILFKSTLGYTAKFKTENNNYIVYLAIFDLNKSENTKYIIIGFSIENIGEIETNENKQYKVLSTIVTITKELLSKEPTIKQIEFGAKNKEKEKGLKSNQRNLFYLKYAQKLLGNEWKLFNTYDENIEEPKTILTKL